MGGGGGGGGGALLITVSTFLFLADYIWLEPIKLWCCVYGLGVVGWWWGGNRERVGGRALLTTFLFLADYEIMPGTYCIVVLCLWIAASSLGTM